MNSSLTLYLAILGGVVLAVFLIHSTWQSRKLAARQPRRAAVEPVDTQAGLPGEPTLGDDLPTQPLDLPAAPGTVPPLKRGHVHLDAKWTPSRPSPSTPP